MADKMNTKAMLITPDWARVELEKLRVAVEEGRFRQRNPKERAIQKYAADMKAGKWYLTHQGIAFDEAGNLLDGQNRLWAVVRSEKSVWMSVTTGVPAVEGGSAMDVIDGGAVRSIADALRISHDFGTSASECASVTRQVVNMVTIALGKNTGRSQGSVVQVSTSEALFVLDALNLRASVDRFRYLVPTRKLRRAPLASVWCWYHLSKPKLAEDFATDYNDLAELKKGSPVIALHRYFEIRSKSRVGTGEIQSTVANAILAWSKNETVTQAAPSREALRWLVSLNSGHAEKILKRVL